VGIKFGMWSTILLLGSAHGLIMALLLVRTPRNRLANRFLALLLFAVVLHITPYTIGYAGFYDVYPWLNFAPFDWRLAQGPLLYFHVRQRFEAQLPRLWLWHFAPGLLQGAYYLVAFSMPLAWKNDWNGRAHVPWVVPFEVWIGHASMLAYWLAALAKYRHWQGWVEEHSAAREEHRLTFLRNFLLAAAAASVLQLAFDATAVVGVKLNYFDRFPLYLAFTALVYYLGLQGWRHAEQVFPSLRREGAAWLDGAPAMRRDAAQPPASAATAPSPNDDAGRDLESGTAAARVLRGDADERAGQPRESLREAGAAGQDVRSGAAHEGDVAPARHQHAISVAGLQ
jgi:hypothetical protein